jgi:hypothetical protein
MTSKRIFSWSKRQSGSEPYYRTGGLLPIETNDVEPSNDFEAKVRWNIREDHSALAKTRRDNAARDEPRSVVRCSLQGSRAGRRLQLCCVASPFADHLK